MATMNEEEFDDFLIESRARAVSYIAETRFERRAPGARAKVVASGTIEDLLENIASFLEKIRPKDGEVIKSRFHPSSDGRTEEISVYRIVKANLDNLVAEIASQREGMKLVEDERDM